MNLESPVLQRKIKYTLFLCKSATLLSILQYFAVNLFVFYVCRFYLYFSIRSQTAVCHVLKPHKYNSAPVKVRRWHHITSININPSNIKDGVCLDSLQNSWSTYCGSFSMNDQWSFWITWPVWAMITTSHVWHIKCKLTC